MINLHCRIVMALVACFIFAGTVALGCSEAEEHVEETPEIETPDPNISTRQKHMKAIDWRNNTGWRRHRQGPHDRWERHFVNDMGPHWMSRTMDRDA